jgi:hypothetical protein
MSDSDAAQPDQGQGGDAPYAEYVNRFPEEYQGLAEEVIRELDGKTTQRFQQNAETMRGWDGYEDTGIRRYQPDQVTNLVQFADALSEPERIKEWYFNVYAPANGLIDEQPDQFTATDDYSYQETGFEDSLKRALEPIQGQMQAMNDWRQQQEDEAAVRAAQQHVEDQLRALEEQHGDRFDREWVEHYIPRYYDDPYNAVQRAFQDTQDRRKQIEDELLAQKAAQPAPALSGGAPNVAPVDVKWENRHEAALAMIRAANQQ